MGDIIRAAHTFATSFAGRFSRVGVTRITSRLQVVSCYGVAYEGRPCVDELVLGYLKGLALNS